MNKLNIYVLEPRNNIDLCNYIKGKYNLITRLSKNINVDVLIVNKVYNINNAINIIDCMLMQGKEIICIKNCFAREHYLANYLIKDGAIYV